VLRLHEFAFNPIRLMLVSIQVHLPMSKKVNLQVRRLQYRMVHDILSTYSVDFEGGRTESLSVFHPAVGYRLMSIGERSRAGAPGAHVSTW
jgi:hypothetical protein